MKSGFVGLTGKARTWSRLGFLLAAMAITTAAPAHAQLKPAPGEQRTADRDAVLASLDRIFQGFIHQNDEELRVTHAPQWIGFLEGSSKVMHGVDQYMAASTSPTKSPVHMTGYKLLEVDVLFYGDVAIVPFVCEIEIGGPGVDTFKRKLRILDIFGKLNGQWVQVATDTAQSPDALMLAMAMPRALDDASKKSLLDAREAVWRGFFAGDEAALEALLPPETLAIEPGSETWPKRDEILAGAKGFAESGGKLIRLDFPKTEMQVYGNTAIIYTTFEYELEHAGKRSTRSGRATEMFVNRGGKWLNTGWHMDEGAVVRSAAQ